MPRAKNTKTTKRSVEKVTVVRTHERHVPVSESHPDGVTVVHRHPRHYSGVVFGPKEISETFEKYDRQGIAYPAKGHLKEYAEADKCDDLIAVWTDYFNKKFEVMPPLDPDMVKALIASESGFRVDPSKNRTAFGIAQITKETLNVLQNHEGEAHVFLFKNIRLKDLKTPSIAIPLCVRWLLRKRELAQKTLKRVPAPEEIILEYKGLLLSKTAYSNKALANFRKAYEELKK